MFKRILVPLDGSEMSERITTFAAGLARAVGAEIILFTVVEPGRHLRPEQAGGDAELRVTGREPSDQARDLAYGYLEKAKEEMASLGLETTIAVASGSPAEEIVRFARDSAVELIAMATGRESALARGVFGSVTDRVLHMSPVPVMAIRPEQSTAFSGTAGLPKRVIVPLDGSELAEEALPVAMELAKTCQAGILLLRTVQIPYYDGGGVAGMYAFPDGTLTFLQGDAQKYIGQVAERLQEKGVEVEARAQLGSAAFKIIEEAESQPGSLIVMTTHGESGFRRFFLGSVADKVVRSSGAPVIVLPPRALAEESALRKAA